MYFPFLYGKQSELLALRHILEQHQHVDSLVPVIEPVNSKASSLLACLNTFNTSGQPIAVIVNPDKHQLKDASDISAWREEILPKIDDLPSVLPTYKCTPVTTEANVDAFLNRFSGRQVALAYTSPALDDSEIRELGNNPDVQFHIVLNQKMPVALQGLLPRDKLVDIRDAFNKRSRNADYSGREFFTDRHVTFSGEYVGFGDYTCIGAEFSASGGQPAAVAIHCVHKGPSNQVWIEHFVSDDKEIGKGNVAAKFFQAATKLANAVKERPHEFGTNAALGKYIDFVGPAPHFPGLPTNKMLQIQHHICFMLNALAEEGG